MWKVNEDSLLSAQAETLAVFLVVLAPVPFAWSLATIALKLSLRLIVVFLILDLHPLWVWSSLLERLLRWRLLDLEIDLSNFGLTSSSLLRWPSGSFLVRLVDLQEELTKEQSNFSVPSQLKGNVCRDKNVFMTCGAGLRKPTLK
jgi:hypothetical protein